MNSNIIQISFFLIVSILLVITQNKLLLRKKIKKIEYNKSKINKILDISLELTLLIFVIYIISLDYINIAILFLSLGLIFKKILKGRVLD